MPPIAIWLMARATGLNRICPGGLDWRSDIPVSARISTTPMDVLDPFQPAHQPA
jgi:hypothetical protein